MITFSVPASPSNLHGIFYGNNKVRSGQEIAKVYGIWIRVIGTLPSHISIKAQKLIQLFHSMVLNFKYTFFLIPIFGFKTKIVKEVLLIFELFSN